MFNPLEYPYVRAQTYVDGNPPAVLSDEFYNPTQDALARLYGSTLGYSTSLSTEEFCRLQLSALTPIAGDPFGTELAVLNNPGGFEFLSVSPSGVNEHGVYRVRGNVAGNRAGAPGFKVGDGQRNIGTTRFIFRARVRCNDFSVIDPSAGLYFGLGDISVFNYPSWIADGTGFWITFWDGGAFTSAIPTVDDEWVTLWITCEDADAKVRWYLKRDADPLPLLIDTRTLAAPDLAGVRRFMRYQVTAGAADLDYVELDSISLGCER